MTPITTPGFDFHSSESDYDFDSVAIENVYKCEPNEQLSMKLRIRSSLATRVFASSNVKKTRRIDIYPSTVGLLWKNNNKKSG